MEHQLKRVRSTPTTARREGSWMGKKQKKLLERAVSELATQRSFKARFFPWAKSDKTNTNASDHDADNEFTLRSSSGVSLASLTIKQQPHLPLSLDQIQAETYHNEDSPTTTVNMLELDHDAQTQLDKLIEILDEQTTPPNTNGNVARFLSSILNLIRVSSSQTFPKPETVFVKQLYGRVCFLAESMSNFSPERLRSVVVDAQLLARHETQLHDWSCGFALRCLCAAIVTGDNNENHHNNSSSNFDGNQDELYGSSAPSARSTKTRSSTPQSSVRNSPSSVMITVSPPSNSKQFALATMQSYHEDSTPQQEQRQMWLTFRMLDEDELGYVDAAVVKRVAKGLLSQCPPKPTQIFLSVLLDQLDELDPPLRPSKKAKLHNDSFSDSDVEGYKLEFAEFSELMANATLDTKEILQSQEVPPSSTPDANNEEPSEEFDLHTTLAAVAARAAVVCSPSPIIRVRKDGRHTNHHNHNHNHNHTNHHNNNQTRQHNLGRHYEPSHSSESSSEDTPTPAPSNNTTSNTSTTPTPTSTATTTTSTNHDFAPAPKLKSRRSFVKPENRPPHQHPASKSWAKKILSSMFSRRANLPPSHESRTTLLVGRRNENSPQPSGSNHIVVAPFGSSPASSRRPSTPIFLV